MEKSAALNTYIMKHYMESKVKMAPVGVVAEEASESKAPVVKMNFRHFGGNMAQV